MVKSKEFIRKYNNRGFYFMTENEKKLLVELICNEQTHMIIKDHTRYDTDKYKELEALKVKIKDM